MSAPEDTSLAKVSWSEQSGESEKYYTDALRVYEAQAGGEPDGEYIDAWAPRLGVDPLWRRVIGEAQKV